MSDPNSIQHRMDEIQRNQTFSDALGKILSGKMGYKPVIETKKAEIKCKKCGKGFDDAVKFCNECGTKIFIKPTSCPKCAKPVLLTDRFCLECGESLEDTN
jgi:hypothetical protein